MNPENIDRIRGLLNDAILESEGTDPSFSTALAEMTL